MKKLFGTILGFVLLCGIMLFSASCEKKPPEPDGTELSSKSMTREGDTFYLTVPNSTENISFDGEFTVLEGAEIQISSSEDFSSTLNIFKVRLSRGNNNYYVAVKNGEAESRYKVVIRRRPLYTVSFETDGGGVILPQVIEEGKNLIEPELVPAKIGCSFSGWNYDFSKPIECDITVTAQYTVDEDMRDFEFVSDGQSCTVTGMRNIPTKLVIPDKVTHIGDRAFYYCKKLTEIDIGDGVREIGTSAFEGCINVTKLTIGESVNEIGVRAFLNCHSLTEITVPEGVSTIAEYAFMDCEALVRITLPESLTTLGGYVFKGCTALPEITVPKGITQINTEAFYKCRNLKKVNFPAGLISIEDSVFYECVMLEDVTLPDGLRRIETWAFKGCKGITEIVLPDSVVGIRRGAFEDCSSLKNVFFQRTDWWFIWDTPIPSDILADPESAAVALTDTYLSKNLQYYPQT